MYDTPLTVDFAAYLTSFIQHNVCALPSRRPGELAPPFPKILGSRGSGTAGQRGSGVVDSRRKPPITCLFGPKAGSEVRFYEQTDTHGCWTHAGCWGFALKNLGRPRL